MKFLEADKISSETAEKEKMRLRAVPRRPMQTLNRGEDSSSN